MSPACIQVTNLTKILIFHDDKILVHQLLHVQISIAQACIRYYITLHVYIFQIKFCDFRHKPSI